MEFSRTFWKTYLYRYMCISVQIALSAVQQIPRHEIDFQNMLASDQHIVAEKAMRPPLICYESFLWIKIKTACHIPQYGGKGVSAAVCPALASIGMEPATY